ncbi:unnamed protein product [Vicia faba]|uniref:Uncharacterized protein n=1 Tax=Vicia faba TaxID=3906 RepID=A0AAV0YGA9_VICFA|nr:unnamed protein product [Vicia faba]
MEKRFKCVVHHSELNDEVVVDVGADLGVDEIVAGDDRAGVGVNEDVVHEGDNLGVNENVVDAGVDLGVNEDVVDVVREKGSEDSPLDVNFEDSENDIGIDGEITVDDEKVSTKGKAKGKENGKAKGKEKGKGNMEGSSEGSGSLGDVNEGHILEENLRGLSDI